MTVFINHTAITSLFYAAATVIIRYIYVRSSLKPSVQAVIKRNAFAVKSILIVESLGGLNLVSAFVLQYEKSGQDRSPFLSYQSCIDPYRQHFTLPFFKIMPINQIFLHITNFCIIFFYISIFKYVDKQIGENKGI